MGDELHKEPWRDDEEWSDYEYWSDYEPGSYEDPWSEPKSRRSSPKLHTSHCRRTLRNRTGNYIRLRSALNELFGALFYQSESHHRTRHKYASPIPSSNNTEKKAADIRSEEIQR